MAKAWSVIDPFPSSDHIILDIDPLSVYAAAYCDESGQCILPDGTGVSINPPPTEPQRKAARAIMALLVKAVEKDEISK
jgi:hypothetical protein